MSCPHGNHVDACDLCDEVNASYKAGLAEGLRQQAERVDDRLHSDSAEDVAQWLYANGHREAARTVRNQLDVRNDRIRELQTALAQNKQAERTGGEGEGIFASLDEAHEYFVEIENEVARITGDEGEDRALDVLRRMPSFSDSPPAQQPGVAVSVSDEIVEIAAQAISKRSLSNAGHPYPIGICRSDARAALEAVASLLAGGVPAIRVSDTGAPRGEPNLYSVTVNGQSVFEAMGSRKALGTCTDLATKLRNALAARPSQPTDAQDGGL